ncbi:porphobilinogen deaminase [Thermanaerovibrio velox DSM 12556]|uniref:Hydroxymethylbilane synthase n=1 Tax=Thermanaerovibrio velox DSM 12556 TaxID=926567 RepID=H0UMV6_9BACT|nr:hydroxymethylbilane synthase [Thermanaerovibrio velox]EHM09251.1 porphobilinogen deaminase [Thermanaerovibrio velox DSM 12556]
MSRFTLLTRSSPLAMAQAEMWKRHLAGAGHSVKLITCATHGDRDRRRHLACFGGFGAFVKALEERLLLGDAHGAVHSLKDVPSEQPKGLAIAAVLKRGSREDVLINLEGLSLDELPEGSVVGTSSLRRTAQVLRLRGDLKVICCRGNIQSRLSKLQEGRFDAIVLAKAGLERLDIRVPYRDLPFVTSPAQGAIALEAPEGSELFHEARRLGDRDSWLEVLAERQFLKAFGMGCAVPVAASAVLDGDIMSFKAEILSPDGSSASAVELRDKVDGEDDAAALGQRAWLKLKDSPEAREILQGALNRSAREGVCGA